MNTSRKSHPVVVGVTLLNGIFLLILAVFTVLNRRGPERWWFTGFLEFMPSYLWLIPAALLLALSVVLAARLAGARRQRVGMVLPPLIAILWVAWPVMGLCLNATREASPGEIRLRVMTYNVKWGWRDAAAISREISETQPDLIQMQDSDGILGSAVGKILSPAAGWTVRSSGQYTVASRWRLSELTWLDISFPGTYHHAVRAQLASPWGGAPITIYDAHLLSPRYGLVAMRSRNIAELVTNSNNRMIEADRLARYIGQSSGPVVLTGDLNAPPYSLVNRVFKNIGLRDAFENAGNGYGFSYGATTKAGLPYVRIDHVMASRDIQIGEAHVGNAVGSDHCPVIADLYIAAR